METGVITKGTVGIVSDIGDAGEMGGNVLLWEVVFWFKKVAYQPVHSMSLNTSSVPGV